MTQLMAAMPNPLDGGQAYNRKQKDKAIFDRSIPVAAGEVLPDSFVEEMIKKAGALDHYRTFIPQLTEAFPEAGIVVKRDHSDDQQVTIELRFPTNGWDMRPQVTEWLDAVEGRRKGYFRLAV